MSEAERSELIEYLAWNPAAGVVMPGTGGVRKVRWAVKGKGKRGGAKVIYYYHDHSLPLFLLTMFPKSVKIDLTQDEKNEMRRLVPALVRDYQARRNG